MEPRVVTPAFLDDLIVRCTDALLATGSDAREAERIVEDLARVRDHLVASEQQGLGEWIRDLPADQLGDFLADMEVTARQADADSDIGSFISAVADWQTTAEANRHGW